MFEFFFKYQPAFFQRGEFELAASWQLYAAAVVIVAVAVPTLLLYSRVKGKASKLDRWVLTGLRASVIALILFSLFQPVLVLSTVAPQRNYVGVLLDNSRSMRIADLNDKPRADFIRQALDPQNSQFYADLAERFELRFFRFAAETERVDVGAPLAFAGETSDLGRALNYARRSLSGVPLAGLIVVSDGSDNGAVSLNESLLALRANGVPVYSVGLGREAYAKDIELDRVQLPRKVLSGTSLDIEVTIRQRGFANADVPLIVEDDGRIVSSQTLTLNGAGSGAGATTAARVRLTMTEPGPRLLRFYVPSQNGETVVRNNEREALILVRDDKERIFYFEGEPRFELKFIRRAVADDENLQVIALMRTAENKFYRMGISDPDELSDGFPKDRKTLFAYRGLILGSVDASFFTQDQLQMIADFANQRGGGILFLGGKQAFAEGGYADTPLAELMPVLFGNSRGRHNDFQREVTMAPTTAGQSHPMLQLAATEQSSLERWAALPRLTLVNSIQGVKPGATVLLQGEDRVGGSYITLAFQRYGRGKVVAFPVQDSWLWQLHSAIDPQDLTHETLWRQLLRWLVSNTPERLEVATPTERVAPGESVTLNAEVMDPLYAPTNDAQVSALIISPTGAETEVQLAPTLQRDGDYSARFVPAEQGLYELRIKARHGEELIAETASYLNVTEDAREYYRAEMRAAELKRIAKQTGGGFYTPASVASLPEDIRLVERGATVVERLDLWDMPVLFFLIVGLSCIEWGYRRWRGLI